LLERILINKKRTKTRGNPESHTGNSVTGHEKRLRSGQRFGEMGKSEGGKEDGRTAEVLGAPSAARAARVLADISANGGVIDFSITDFVFDHPATTKSGSRGRDEEEAQSRKHKNHFIH